MREEDIWKAIGELDDDIIQNARMPKKAGKSPWKAMKWTAVAACLCLTLAGARAIVAEAEETKEALEYFNEEGLSTEGLTRGEIKAVYKDIKTESYSLPLTTELLAKRLAELEFTEEPVKAPVIEPKGGVALAGLVKVGEDTAVYCNTEANVLLGDESNEASNLVCHDPVYGITYYINSGNGRNCYIYAFRGGNSELAVAIPAQTLYCRDGKVYFLAMEGPGTGNSSTGYNSDEVGQIFSYNPVDGAVEQVVERKVRRMRVYPDGIHFIELESYSREMSGDVLVTGRGDEKYYYYSFATGEITEQEVGSICRAGEWLIRDVWGDVPYRNEKGEEYEVIGIAGFDFFNLSGEKVSHFDTLPYQIRSFRISGENLYYFCSGWQEPVRLMEYNYVTGEQKEVCEFERQIALGNPIVFGDVVYTRGKLRIDLTDGSCSYLSMPLSAQDSSVSYREEWYTDGENLFYFSGTQMFLYKETKREYPVTVTDKDMEGKLYLAYDVKLIPLGK